MFELNEYIRYNKKKCIIFSVFLLVFICIYIFTMFIPGIRHNDAFLYKNADGIYKGSDAYAEYIMKITKKDNISEIDFKVNSTLKKYKISQSGDAVEIYENDILKFKGTVINIEGTFILKDENENLHDIIKVTAGNIPPTDEELFPGLTTIYSRSVNADETRGNLFFMIVALFSLALLITDFIFPKLTFHFKHGLYVEYAEPNDVYISGQKFGWFIGVVLVIGFIIASYTV